MTDRDRYAKGLEIIEKLVGELAPEVTDPVPIHRDFMRMTVEHLFGEVWARPGLALRDRSLITLAALTALGRERQLRNHLKIARHIGITRDEIVEVMVHLAHYGGWPAARTGLAIAEEVFVDAGGSDDRAAE